MGFDNLTAGLLVPEQLPCSLLKNLVVEMFEEVGIGFAGDAAIGFMRRAHCLGWEGLPGRGAFVVIYRKPPPGRNRDSSPHPDTDPVESGDAIEPEKRHIAQGGEAFPLAGHSAAENPSLGDGEACVQAFPIVEQAAN